MGPVGLPIVLIISFHEASENARGQLQIFPQNENVLLLNVKRGDGGPVQNVLVSVMMARTSFHFTHSLELKKPASAVLNCQ